MQNPRPALRSPSVVVQSIAQGCTGSGGDERRSSWPAYRGLEIPPCTNARQSDACHAGVRLPGPSGSDKVAITVLVIFSTIAHRAHNISFGASEAGTDLSPEKCGRVRTRVRRPRRPCLGCRWLPHIPVPRCCAKANIYAISSSVIQMTASSPAVSRLASCVILVAAQLAGKHSLCVIGWLCLPAVGCTPAHSCPQMMQMRAVRPAGPARSIRYCADRPSHRARGVERSPAVAAASSLLGQRPGRAQRE